MLRLRLDGDVDDGLGEVERLEHDRRVDGTQRLAGHDALQADDSLAKNLTGQIILPGLAESVGYVRGVLRMLS